MEQKVVAKSIACTRRKMGKMKSRIWQNTRQKTDAADGNQLKARLWFKAGKDPGGCWEAGSRPEARHGRPGGRNSPSRCRGLDELSNGAGGDTSSLATSSRQRAEELHEPGRALVSGLRKGWPVDLVMLLTRHHRQKPAARAARQARHVKGLVDPLCGHAILPFSSSNAGLGEIGLALPWQASPPPIPGANRRQNPMIDPLLYCAPLTPLTHLFPVLASIAAPPPRVVRRLAVIKGLRAVGSRGKA